MRAQPPVPGVSPGHVLLVDDEMLILRVARAGLESLGYTVTVEQSPVTALSLVSLAAEPFDMVVTDINMPEMTGIELVKAIRMIQPAMPILVMSGLADREALDEVQTLGAHFMPKPYTRAEFSLALVEARSAITRLRESLGE